MRLLLDTHVLLWALSEPTRIAPAARRAIESRSNTVHVSAASAWEMEIKRALGKLRTPDDLDGELRATGFVELPVRVAHVSALRKLPKLHRDPFDRLLVAQAIAEGLTLVTRDEVVARYAVATLRA